MLDSDIKIGEKVWVNADREHAGYWEGEALTIVGIYIPRNSKELDICLEDSTGFRSDGWLSSDLTKAVEA